MIENIPKYWNTTLIQECYEYRNEIVSDKYHLPIISN